MDLEGRNNIALTRHDCGVQADIAFCVVGIGVQFDSNVGIDRVEVSNHRIHALGALKGDVEADGSRNRGVVVDDPAINVRILVCVRDGRRAIARRAGDVVRRSLFLSAGAE